LQPAGYEGQTVVYASQLNPYFAAGWVGLMITGLNMMPVSQLDGGHVSYTLLGTTAHWLARAFLIATFLYMVFAEAPMFSPMAILVAVMGVDHPPTADDEAEMGVARYVIGIASLAIPVLCFPVEAIVV
jgi:membrane-associated protease RseP (regulator of RpoE activity)